MTTVAYKLKKELMKKSKEDIIKYFMEDSRCLKQWNTKISKKLYSKQGQIRHFRTMLNKIKRDIDYLLKHPYGTKL